MWRIRLARNNSTGTDTYKSKKEGKVEMRKFKPILKKGESKGKQCNNIRRKRKGQRQRTKNKSGERGSIKEKDQQQR